MGQMLVGTAGDALSALRPAKWERSDSARWQGTLGPRP